MTTNKPLKAYYQDYLAGRISYDDLITASERAIAAAGQERRGASEPRPGA